MFGNWISKVHLNIQGQRSSPHLFATKSEYAVYAQGGGSASRLLARRASRHPGTPLERKMDAQIRREKGNYFQLFP
jgi:hypothetical protein